MLQQPGLPAQQAQTLVSFLAQLGRDHRKYGVTQHHYDVVGQVLIAALQEDPACNALRLHKEFSQTRLWGVGNLEGPAWYWPQPPC